MTTTTQDEDLEFFAEEVFSGEGLLVQRLRLQVARIAPHFRIALLTGERGTGKRTVARELHRLSPSSARAFKMQAIDAFARSQEDPGSPGALFLTGLERLDIGLQEALLDRLRQLDRETRVIVASECDLRGLVAVGRMRQDLHAKVGTLEIRLAPIRERTDDLETIFGSMLKRLESVTGISSEAIEKMKSYGWRGNLGELWQVAERVAGVGGTIGLKDLPTPELTDGLGSQNVRLEEVMRRHVMEVLQRCAGNKLRTAEMLGISRSTLYRMLEAAPQL